MTRGASAAALLRLSWRAVHTDTTAGVLQVPWRDPVVGHRDRKNLLRHLADRNRDPRRVDARGIEPVVIADGVVAAVVEEQVRAVGRRVHHGRGLHGHEDRSRDDDRRRLADVDLYADLTLCGRSYRDTCG